MFVISSRLNGTNGNVFSEADRVFHLNDDMTLQPNTNEELLEQIKQKNILLLIHGFNDTFADVLELFSTIKQQSRKFFGSEYDAVVGYSWPGGESKFNYFQAKQNARIAGHRLQHWLYQFCEGHCTIDIIGHSMASQVGFTALQSKVGISVRNIFSFGAALSKNIAKDDREGVRNILDNVGHFYLFHTRNDSILKYWFRMVEWHAALGYLGMQPEDELVFQSEKFRVVDCSEVVQDHTAYSNSKEVFQFIGALLLGFPYPKYYSLKSGSKGQFGDPPTGEAFNFEAVGAEHVVTPI